MMRIDEGIQHDLWSITMGIFNLGNVKFKKEGDGFASIHPDTQKFVDEVARLWAINSKALTKRLTTRTLKVMKKKIERQIPFDDATKNRDSIAMGVYENVFLYLCERINAELYQTDEDDTEDVLQLYIGILDVFGFENFRINSLEQFCINYMDEKLQQFFNYHVNERSRSDHPRGGWWKSLVIADNVDFFNLVEDKDRGFFRILDAACMSPQPSCAAFMQDLFKRHGKNPCLKRVTKPGSGNTPKTYRRKPKRGKGYRFDGFEIKHFADKVAYQIDKFLVKNMRDENDQTFRPLLDTKKMLMKSKTVLVKEIGRQGHTVLKERTDP